MSSSKWIQIVVGEFQSGQRSGLLYREIIQDLMKDRFCPVIVTRADKGLGEKNDVRAQSLESIQFNNLPIVIETMGNEEQLERLVPILKNKVSHGQLVSVSAHSPLEEIVNEEESKYVMLKIYFLEKSLWLGRPPHEEILSMLQKQHLIWSIVKRGIAGFGSDQIIRKSGFFSRPPVPVIIECIGEAKVIRDMIPDLKRKTKQALMIVLPLQMIVNQ